MRRQIMRLKNRFSWQLRQLRRDYIDKASNLWLLLSKGIQKKRFEEFSAQCSQDYVNLRREDISKFMTKAWGQKNQVMERLILPKPNFSFLRDPAIRETMFLSDDSAFFRGQLSFCEKFYPAKHLKQFLEEDYAGRPIIRSFKYLTSHNRVHHLYHVLKFQSKTGTALKSLTEVIEWGGGYGNMARLLHRISPGITYTIIDIPLFSCIQWIYLVATLGEARINLIRCREDKIEKNKINLLPLCFLDWYDLKTDCFIATWSLSESSDYALHCVKSADFFNARHLLLAYQDSSESFPNASETGRIAKTYGAEIEAFEFCPGNYYALK